MAAAQAKPFEIDDIVVNANIRKSKLCWFLREAINVYGARSLFLASSKKEPVNMGIVAYLALENDTVEVLVQNEQELVNYDLLVKNFSVKKCDPSVKTLLGDDVDIQSLSQAIVDDPKWKFIERDCIKFTLRLGILTPPEGANVADLIPHNEAWAAYKESQERKKKGAQT
ncbi:hypothetical protein R1sor_010385 [Riccia sorocarpa]|uniref:Uncharacterized protein n=1 Tax=Riccia sorocarpa TaxID=122646 RepID=A0ABD3HZS3_9MARC